jgi:hypothetical protein
MGEKEQQKAKDLWNAIQRAGGKLPEFWEISIVIENGAAWVFLSNDMDAVEFPSNQDSLAEAINDAVAFALEKGGQQ